MISIMTALNDKSHSNYDITQNLYLGCLFFSYTKCDLQDGPIAHTCNYLLELLTSYVNYNDFAAEFKAILSSTENEFAWRMDAI
jgi:hypothetical protein